MSNPDGTPIWFELMTADQAQAGDFYAAIAGWTLATSPMAEHGGYTIATAPGGAEVAGIMAAQPGAADMQGWTIYFGVADVDAASARVKELGGQVHFGPMDIPHVGRFAAVADPQGVVFALMTGASPEASRAFAPAEKGAGQGVWIELATPDPDAAFAFYGALFGWTKAGAMPMGDMGEYAFIGAGDAAPGAVMSSTATGTPARWQWYVQAPDIDAAVAAVSAGGGTLLQGPDQIPTGDYGAVLADPAGHRFGVSGPRVEQVA